MIPWRHLGSAEMPGGGGELRLMQRGAEFSIMLGTTELMNSRRSGSEEALAAITCERIHDRRRPNMLIGGLGMGFTLRTALAELGDDATVTIAELVPSVVAWAKGPMAGIFGDCLNDPRLTIVETGVEHPISTGNASYDAILLDVDNGPEGLTRKANDDLYSTAGLRAAHRALRPGGVLAVWSSSPNQAFTQRLNRTGFIVDEVKARARGKRGGARHVIWLAAKPGARS